jgi:hypothetical protein
MRDRRHGAVSGEAAVCVGGLGGRSGLPLLAGLREAVVFFLGFLGSGGCVDWFRICFLSI